MYLSLFYGYTLVKDANTWTCIHFIWVLLNLNQEQEQRKTKSEKMTTLQKLLNNWTSYFPTTTSLYGPVCSKLIAESMAARIFNNDLHLFVKAVIVKVIKSLKIRTLGS